MSNPDHGVTITFQFDPENLGHLSGGGNDRVGRTPEETAEVLMELYIPRCLTKNIVSIVAEDVWTLLGDAEVSA